MSSGMRVRRAPNREASGPKLKYWFLKEEILKREIALIDFAKALEVTPEVLAGINSPFPSAKIERVIELLNNWTGPRRPHAKSVRPSQPKPVTLDMLLIS